MDLYLILLRLLHIGAGVFWVGASLFLVYYIAPTATAAGPPGQQFLGRLVRAGTVSALAATGALTALSGLLLFWRVSGRLQGAWLASPTGLALSIGGLAGVAAAVIGVGILRPLNLRLAALGAAAAAAGAPPTPEGQAEMAQMAATVARFSRITAYLLMLAVTTMAVARYL